MLRNVSLIDRKQILLKKKTNLSSGSTIIKFAARMTMRISHSQVSGQLGHPKPEYGAG